MASAPIKDQPALKASDIKLSQLNFGIDNHLPYIEEGPQLFTYYAPAFRTSVSVEIPKLPPGANIQIGWIQVCTDKTLVIEYGDLGIASMENPELVSGKFTMVSDAHEEFPWYGRNEDIISVKGPTNDKTTATTCMKDNIGSEIVWHVPNRRYPPDHLLTFVYRKNEFYDYLALKDLNTNTYQILKTLTWTMEIAIDVNVENPVGKRCQLLGLFQQQCPKVVPPDQVPQLQCYALKPPTCNNGQALFWRSKDGDTEIIDHPKVTTMDLCNYALHSDVHTKRLMLITKENFLSRQI